MIDLTCESAIRLEDAAKSVPPSRNGKRTHVSTILRWILDGVRSPSGEIVHLEAIRLGRKWVTSREALQRFAERLTPGTVERPKTPRPPVARQKAAERAGKALEKLGI